MVFNYTPRVRNHVLDIEPEDREVFVRIARRAHEAHANILAIMCMGTQYFEETRRIANDVFLQNLELGVVEAADDAAVAADEDGAAHEEEPKDGRECDALRVAELGDHLCCVEEEQTHVNGSVA
jgi:hypothetical protein